MVLAGALSNPSTKSFDSAEEMVSLVVLECTLWLTLTEIKDADKVPFLDLPVFPSGLFGLAVKGFKECLNAAQKLSQAMRQFLPKCSRSMAASSCPKSAPAQQPAKPTTPFTKCQ